jgi:hypothetical protein
MSTYNCNSCNFSTPLKSNYTTHLLSKKHIRNCKSDVSHCKSHQADYSCKYCGQKYKHRQSVTKHIKYSCTKNKTEDLTELVRLLNLQMESQSKQIEKLMEKLEIH